MEELVFKQKNALTNVPDISLVPVLADEDVSLASYTKYPLSKLNSLGVAFEPLTSAIHNVFGASGGTTQLCQVTVPAGTHLASFKSGVGNLGTVLNANNQIAGQAVINPLVCNPTMLFMAAALASIDKKLDSILETQHDMMEFLEQKEESELRGNLRFLADVFNNFRFNWNNEKFKNAGHIKVLDIRQSAEQKIDFYQKQIQSKLKKKALVQSDQDVKKRLEKISSQFKDYFFNSFMENTPTVAEYVAKQENEKAADYRNSSGGNLLFRPIALTEFLSAALKLYKEEEQSFDPVFRKLSRVPLIISEEPWRGLLWDGARIINRASRPLIQSIILYLTDSEMLDEKRYSNMVEGYAKAINSTAEYAEQILHRVKNEK